MKNKDRGSLLAGAAKVNITPEDLSGLTNLWGTPFEGIHDPNFARALVVDNGINCAAIIAADLVEFGSTAELRAQIKKETNIPIKNIIVTASHDHNAPRVGNVTPGVTAQKGGPATEKYTCWFMNASSMLFGRPRQSCSQPSWYWKGSSRSEYKPRCIHGRRLGIRC